MADQPRRPRTLNDARTEAEAAFKKVTAKVAEPSPKKNTVPGAREQITLRIDQDVLEVIGPSVSDFRLFDQQSLPVHEQVVIVHGIASGLLLTIDFGDVFDFPGKAVELSVVGLNALSNADIPVAGRTKDVR